MYRRSKYRVDLLRRGEAVKPPVAEASDLNVDTYNTVFDYLKWILPSFIKRAFYKTGHKIKALLTAAAEELQIVRQTISELLWPALPETSSNNELSRLGAIRGVKRYTDDDGSFKPKVQTAFEDNLDQASVPGLYKACERLGIECRIFENYALAMNVSEPPDDASGRDMYIVGGSGEYTFDQWEDGEEGLSLEQMVLGGTVTLSGEFVDHAYELALWEDNEWHFLKPAEGTVINVLEFNDGYGLPYIFDGESWSVCETHRWAHMIISITDFSGEYLQKWFDQMIIDTHVAHGRTVIECEAGIKPVEDMELGEGCFDSFVEG